MPYRKSRAVNFLLDFHKSPRLLINPVSPCIHCTEARHCIIGIRIKLDTIWVTQIYSNALDPRDGRATRKWQGASEREQGLLKFAWHTARGGTLLRGVIFHEIQMDSTSMALSLYIPAGVVDEKRPGKEREIENAEERSRRGIIHFWVKDRQGKIEMQRDYFTWSLFTFFLYIVSFALRSTILWRESHAFSRSTLYSRELHR